MSHRR